MKLLPLTLICLALAACSKPSVKEYFCEAYVPEGQSRYYKQQVVQLSNESFCLLGVIDLPVCAKHNQSTFTPWRTLNNKMEVREAIQVKLGKDLAVMDIDQETRPTGAAQASPEPMNLAMHYEFQRRAGMLTLTSKETTEPQDFACKPWTKRAWWQIY